MPKLIFSKKDRLPQIENLNPQLPSLNLVWLIILGLSGILVILSILFSAIQSWTVMSVDLSSSNADGDSSTIIIDKEKLINAVDAIKNRLNLN